MNVERKIKIEKPKVEASTNRVYVYIAWSGYWDNDEYINSEYDGWYVQDTM